MLQKEEPCKEQGGSTMLMETSHARNRRNHSRTIAGGAVARRSSTMLLETSRCRTSRLQKNLSECKDTYKHILYFLLFHFHLLSFFLLLHHLSYIFIIFLFFLSLFPQLQSHRINIYNFYNKFGDVPLTEY